MPTQSIALLDHSANPEQTTDNMTTLSATGAGNGFEVPFNNALLFYLHNPTGSNATVTFKSQPTQAETDRGLTPTDETVTINTGANPYTWYPDTRFKDSNGKVIIEADQLIQIKVVKKITIT